MTDINDLLARGDRATDHFVDADPDLDLEQLITELTAALQTEHEQLAAARAVTRRLIGFVGIDDPAWSDAERAWLMSVEEDPDERP